MPAAGVDQGWLRFNSELPQHRRQQECLLFAVPVTSGNNRVRTGRPKGRRAYRYTDVANLFLHELQRVQCLLFGCSAFAADSTYDLFQIRAQWLVDRKEWGHEPGDRT